MWGMEEMEVVKEYSNIRVAWWHGSTATTSTVGSQQVHLCTLVTSVKVALFDTCI